MRFLTTRGSSGHASGVSFFQALIEGLGPDGGLYVPETIEPWAPHEIARLSQRTLTEVAYRALRPYTREELDAVVGAKAAAAVIDYFATSA